MHRSRVCVTPDPLSEKESINFRHMGETGCNIWGKGDRLEILIDPGACELVAPTVVLGARQLAPLAFGDEAPTRARTARLADSQASEALSRRPQLTRERGCGGGRGPLKISIKTMRFVRELAPPALEGAQGGYQALDHPETVLLFGPMTLVIPREHSRG